MGFAATFSNQLRTMFGAKPPDPSYPVLPEIGENLESSIPGLYLTGSISYFPTTGHFVRERYYDIDPVGFDLPGYWSMLTPLN